MMGERVNKFHEERKGQQVSWREKGSTSFMKGEMVNKFHEEKKGQQVSWREKWSTSFMRRKRVNMFHEGRNGQQVSWREKWSTSFMKGEMVREKGLICGIDTFNVFFLLACLSMHQITCYHWVFILGRELSKWMLKVPYFSKSL